MSTKTEKLGPHEHLINIGYWLSRPIAYLLFLQFCKQLEHQLNWVKNARREPIGLPFDGQSFNDETPGECADRLVCLHELGYIFPLHIIDELRAEEQEQQANATLAKTE